jgi:hypothetical protein
VTSHKDDCAEHTLQALQLIFAQVADRELATTPIDVACRPFDLLPRTTWVDLSDIGVIERVSAFGAEQYRLTLAGWLHALKEVQGLDHPAVLHRCEMLTQALTSIVKGRAAGHDVLADVWTIQVRAQLPLGWIFNAIESGLLQQVFPNETMNASWDRPSRAFRVPATFGMARR